MDKLSQSTLTRTVSSYDRLAERFHGTFQASRYHSELSFKQRLRVFRQMMGHPKEQLILDAGCGAGLYSEFLSKQNTVVGIDYSYEMGRLAAQKGLGAVTGDLRALPFSSASFDLVLSIEVLQHFEKAQPVLENLAAVVRPGGCLFIASLNPYSLLHFLYQPFGAYTDLFFHSIDHVSAILSNLNFDIQDLRLLSYPLGWQWEYTGWGTVFSCLGSSWILSAVKK